MDNLSLFYSVCMRLDFSTLPYNLKRKTLCKTVNRGSGTGKKEISNLILFRSEALILTCLSSTLSLNRSLRVVKIKIFLKVVSLSFCLLFVCLIASLLTCLLSCFAPMNSSFV